MDTVEGGVTMIRNMLTISDTAQALGVHEDTQAVNKS